jgi:hypothetical protein
VAKTNPTREWWFQHKDPSKEESQPTETQKNGEEYIFHHPIRYPANRSCNRSQIMEKSIQEFATEQILDNDSFESRPDTKYGGAVGNLSWGLDDINKQVGHVGLQGKFTKASLSAMGMQLATVVYYALMWSLMLQRFNSYYMWDAATDDAASGSQGSSLSYYPSGNIHELESVMTDVESFECNGTVFFLNGTGPYGNMTTHMTNSSLDDISIAQFAVILVPCILIFIFSRLYFGYYNQLLLLVKFRKDESGQIVPVKFSVAFAILCNVSKLGNIAFTDVCKYTGFNVYKLKTCAWWFRHSLIACFVVLNREINIHRWRGCCYNRQHRRIRSWYVVLGLTRLHALLEWDCCLGDGVDFDMRLLL